MNRLLLLGILALAAAGESEQARLERGEIVATRNRVGGGILSGTARVIVAAPVEQVWAVLLDAGKFHEYMPRYLASDLVGGDVAERARALGWGRAELEKAAAENRLKEWPGDTVFFYNVLDMPFPVSDRWYLLEMVRDNVSHTIQWNMVAGNMKENYGGWVLESAGPDRTLVTYFTCSDPGISLPNFMLDIGLKSALPGVVAGLRKRVMGQK